MQLATTYRLDLDLKNFKQGFISANASIETLKGSLARLNNTELKIKRQLQDATKGAAALKQKLLEIKKTKLQLKIDYAKNSLTSLRNTALKTAAAGWGASKVLKVGRRNANNILINDSGMAADIQGKFLSFTHESRLFQKTRNIFYNYRQSRYSKGLECF